jgi:Toprim-like
VTAVATMNAREVLDRTDLAELLTSLSGPPTGSGRSARWSCFSPDHVDDNPSVSMFVDGKGVERWRCWSDGQAGTAIDAVMIGHNLDVTGALQWLRERAGDYPEPPARTPTAPVVRPLSSALHSWINECEHRLWRPEGDNARAWLHARGLGDEVLRANRTGFDPGAHITPRAKGLPRWRGVTVCAFDPTGQLAYVQVRNRDGQAPSKYSNPTPDHGSLPAVTFPRGAPTSGPVVVSEGVLDGLVVAQAGFRSAALISTSSIATGPTSPAAEDIVLHARGELIVLALDGDPAGRAATARLCHQLDGAAVQVLRIPDNEDLSSLHARRKDPSWPTPEHSHRPTQTASSQR